MFLATATNPVEQVSVKSELEEKIVCVLLKSSKEEVDNEGDDSVEKERFLSTVYHVCDNIYPAINILTMQAINSHPEVLFLCDVCGKKFILEIEMQKLKVTHEETRVCCDHCQGTYMYKNKSVLLKHVKNVHPNNLLSCKECSKKYTLEVNLKNHVRSTHYEGPNSCGECPKRFSRNANLQAHIKECP